LGRTKSSKKTTWFFSNSLQAYQPRQALWSTQKQSIYPQVGYFNPTNKPFPNQPLYRGAGSVNDKTYIKIGKNPEREALSKYCSGIPFLSKIINLCAMKCPIQGIPGSECSFAKKQVGSF